MPNVRRRAVFLIGGYEPKSSAEFYRRTERELTRYAATWDVSARVLDSGDEDDGRVARMRIETDHGDRTVQTDWRFMVWNDIVLADFAKPFWYRIARYGLTVADYVLTGTLFRFFWLAWRFALYFLYPAAMHLLFALIGWAAGAIIAGTGLPGAVPIGWAVGVAVFLIMWRIAGERWHVRHLADLWSFSRNYLRGHRGDAEERINRFAALIVECARQGGDDELLLVGHSTGGALILDAAARALAMEPRLTQLGPRIQILTVGSTALKIGLHPAARAFRAGVQTLVDEPAICWSEWQALTDVINFYRTDPVAAMGLRPRTGKAFPEVTLLRVRDQMQDDVYRRIRRNFFRVHYQFIMASTTRYPFDFLMACCGPDFLESAVPDRPAAEGVQ